MDTFKFLAGRRLVGHRCRAAASVGLAAILLGAAPTLALANSSHSDSAYSFGRPGKAAEVDRTIHIKAKEMAFTPSQISIEAGETIRFVIENTGHLPHDFTLGPPALQAVHRAEMAAAMAGDEGHGDLHHEDEAEDRHEPEGGAAGSRDHDDPNAVMVAPGETGDIIWTFGEAHDIEFACNAPGHYEAGMRGDLAVHAPSPDKDM